MSATPPIILHTDKPEESAELLASVHPGVVFRTCNSYQALPVMLKETAAEIVYSVRFDGTPGFPREALLDSATVRWVSVGGSGTDHLHPWDPAKLTVTNAAGVAADMMAEYVLGAMLHFSLNFDHFRRAQRECRWISGRVSSLKGKTVLILGMGATGRAVAGLARAMQMRTIGVRAQVRDTPEVDAIHGRESLAGLWGLAEFIICCGSVRMWC